MGGVLGIKATNVHSLVHQNTIIFEPGVLVRHCDPFKWILCECCCCPFIFQCEFNISCRISLRTQQSGSIQKCIPWGAQIAVVGYVTVLYTKHSNTFMIFEAIPASASQNTPQVDCWRKVIETKQRICFCLNLNINQQNSSNKKSSIFHSHASLWVVIWMPLWWSKFTEIDPVNCPVHSK